MKTENYLWIKNISDWIIDRFNYVNPEIANFIGCQCALESAFGKSTIAIENHNILGMKLPKVRLSTAIGENRGHAVYPSIYSCLCDFFYWLQWNRFTKSDLSKDLISYLRKFRRCGYCPSSEYINKINLIYQQFKSYKDE